MSDRPPMCTKPDFASMARWKAGEVQRWCATCRLFPFAADMAACPVAQADLGEEGKIETFYRNDARRQGGRKKKA